MERNPNPDPNCPHCRGTGRIELLTSSQPCEECTAKPAFELVPCPPPPWGISAEDWKALMFPPAVQPEPAAPEPTDRPLVFSERLRIAGEAMAWLSRARALSSDSVNIVTALSALGYLRRKPESRAEKDPAGQ